MKRGEHEILDYYLPSYRHCTFCRGHHSHPHSEYCYFLGGLVDYDRLFLPKPLRREAMSTATIIGITMTIIAVLVYIGYRIGWIK